MSEAGYPTGREIEEALRLQHDERLRHLLDGQVPDWFERAIKTGSAGVVLDDWRRDLLDAYQPDFEEVEP